MKTILILLTGLFLLAPAPAAADHICQYYVADELDGEIDPWCTFHEYDSIYQLKPDVRASCDPIKDFDRCFLCPFLVEQFHLESVCDE